MKRNAVLVTGSSSGLGLDAAVYLAGRGFAVYAALRDLGRTSALTEAAEAEGVNIVPVQLDVTDPNQVREAVTDVEHRAGGLFGLVNNAGIQVRGYFEDMTEDEIRRVFEVNVFGAMRVTRAVLPGMREARRGRVIFVSSIAGHLSSPSLSAYCASKFAMRGFSEALSLECQPLGIQVSSIAPPIVRTEIWRRNRGVAAGARKPDSPYARYFARSEALTDRMVQRAKVTPRDVSRRIEHALSDRRPRLHYVVGARASGLLTLRKAMPGD